MTNNFFKIPEPMDVNLQIEMTHQCPANGLKQTKRVTQSIIITKFQYTENKETIPNASGEEEKYQLQNKDQNLRWHWSHIETPETRR